MPFPTQKLSSTLLRLVDNPLYTIKCSTYLVYLFDLQSIKTNEPHPWRHPAYRRFLLSRLALYTLVLLYILRCIYVVVLLTRFGPSSIDAHLYVDPFYSLGILFFGKALNAFTMAIISLFGVFFIAIDYAFSFALDAHLVGSLRQLSLLNSERFFILNDHLQAPKLRLLSPVENYRQGRAWAKAMWSPPRDTQLTFAHAHLEAFPNLSPTSRSRLVLLSLLIEVASAGMSALLGLSTIFTIITFLTLVTLQFGPLHIITLVCLVDGTLLCAVVLHNGTNLSFALYGLAIPLLMTRLHTQEMNQSLKHLLERLEKTQNNPKQKKLSGNEVTTRRSTRRQVYLSRLEAALREQLSFFFAEHRRLQYLQQYLNDKVASNLLLVSFLIGVLVQIVLANIWLLHELNWHEKVVFLFIVVNTSAMFLQVSRVTVAWTEALYSAVGHLYKAQSLLMVSPESTPGRGPYFARGQYFAVVSAKLHLMTYYELLCTDEKLLFTVGQLGSISKFSLYEFFYAYTGFFMFITMFMKDLSGSTSESADGYSLIM